MLRVSLLLVCLLATAAVIRCDQATILGGDDEFKAPFTEEQFHDMVHDMMPKQKIEKIDMVKKLFTERDGEIDRKDYFRLLYGFLRNLDDLPEHHHVESIKKHEDGVEPTQDAEITEGYYLKFLVNKFIDSKKKTTFDLKDVYADVFKQGITKFLNNMEPEQEAWDL